MKKILFSLLCIFIALPSLAFDNNDYKKFVEKVKEEVWGQDLPQFKNFFQAEDGIRDPR